MGPRIDLVGRQFGRLTVLKYAGTLANRHATWLCRCSCGAERSVAGNNLQSGMSTSCGCFTRERASEANRTHGRSRNPESAPEYRSWKHMRDRCRAPTNKDYRLYGARGIAVCERWGDFENFYADMGPRPKGLTLERLNNDHDYSPTNCRWMPPSVQNRNKRNNVWVELRGERMVFEDACRHIGANPRTIRSRLKSGWSMERALETPVAA